MLRQQRRSRQGTGMQSAYSGEDDRSFRLNVTGAQRVVLCV
jgi:hypothetical protein